jgi:NTP pyrophosphatase (non-canonical NTP hydrolase)
MVDTRYESQHVHQALAHLIEELGEAVNAAGKTARFGFLSSNPELAFGQTNAEWLLKELADVELTIKILRAFMKASYNDDTSTWVYAVEN